MPVREKLGRSGIRTILVVTVGCALAALLVLVGLALHISFLIPALFKLNKECQEEGYYMAEFEFKMMGFAYQLDEGRYVEAVSGIRRLHDQLRSRRDFHKR